jgi:ATP-dependent Clp protease ATP-binding subunit ClpA
VILATLAQADSTDSASKQERDLDAETPRHTLVGAGKADGAMDASNLLKPALARGELHCVGATTLDEYRKHVEKDAALARRFQPVFVSQPTVEDTISILRGLKDRYEAHHGVRITDPAIIAAATLSDRYIADRFLPDKAIDLIDEAAARQRMQVDSKPEELDEFDRRIMELKIEQEALKKETDTASKDRRPSGSTSSAVEPRNASNSASTAWAINRRAPVRRISVSESSIAPFCRRASCSSRPQTQHNMQERSFLLPVTPWSRRKLATCCRR